MWRSLPACAVLVATLALLAACPLAAQEAGAASQLVEGIAALDEGRYSDAAGLLQQVVEAEPKNEPAWFHLGKARFMDKDYPGALEALRKALELAPKRPGTRVFIGRIYEQQGALEEAVRVYQEEARRTTGVPKAEADVALGRAYFKVGMYPDAVVALNAALDLENKHVEALYWLGQAQTKLKQYAAAIKTFTAAKQILDDHSMLKAKLGRLTPEQQRERKVTEETLAQQYNWALDFAQNLGLWPALNKALGDTYLDMRDWMMARNSYRHALDRNQGGDPTDASVYAKIARAYLADAKQVFEEQSMLIAALGVIKAAETSADKALENDAKLAEGYEVRGEIYTFQARTYESDPDRKVVSHTYEDAAEAFSKALEQDPEYVAAMLGLARVNVLQSRQETPGSTEAQDYLQKARGLVAQALALQPEAPEQFTLLAEIANAEEKYDEALGHAEKALTLQKDYDEAMNAAGLAHYLSGRLPRALDYFRQALEQAPRNPEYHFNLGNALFQMKSWDLARRSYRDALRYTPTAKLAKTAYQRAYIDYQIALTYHETRRFDAEIESLNDALALDPNYFQAYLQLARAYADSQQYRAAQKALAQAEQRAAEDKDISRVKLISGVVYEMSGDLHSAAAAYSAAVQLDESNVLAQQALARLSGQQS